MSILSSEGAEISNKKGFYVSSQETKDLISDTL